MDAESNDFPEGLMPDSRLYEDVISAKGLENAISEAGEPCGISIVFAREPHAGSGAKFISAFAQSSRGNIRVRMGVECRSFSISISDSFCPWADGATASLESVAGVIKSWQNGASLDRLCSEYPFMSYGARAKAREDGRLVAFQWSVLFAEELADDLRDLVAECYRNPELSKCYVSLSHGRILLAVDHLDDSAERIVGYPVKGGYLVKIAGPEFDGNFTVSAAAASRRMVELLHQMG